MSHVKRALITALPLAAVLAIAVAVAPAGAVTTGGCSADATATVGAGMPNPILPELTPSCRTIETPCLSTTNCEVIGRVKATAAGVLTATVHVLDTSTFYHCGPAVNSCEATSGGGWYAPYGDARSVDCWVDGMAALAVHLDCRVTMVPL